MTVTVCIPIYNESRVVENCAAALYGKMNSLGALRGWDFEVIFCDDGSTDDCRRKAEAFAKDKEKIKVIGYEKNRGKGAAVKHAVASSRGDVVLFTDCDLAYGVDVIEDAVLRISGGESDIVTGSRNLTDDGYSGYGRFRRFASRAYIKILSAIGKLGLSDSQCGFKAFRGDAAREVFGYCECPGFAFDYEVILIARRLGMKISEMPVKIINHSESTVHVVSDSLSMLRDIFRIKKRVSKLELPGRT